MVARAGSRGRRYWFGRGERQRQLAASFATVNLHRLRGLACAPRLWADFADRHERQTVAVLEDGMVPGMLVRIVEFAMEVTGTVIVTALTCHGDNSGLRTNQVALTRHPLYGLSSG